MGMSQAGIGSPTEAAGWSALLWALPHQYRFRQHIGNFQMVQHWTISQKLPSMWGCGFFPSWGFETHGWVAIESRMGAVQITTMGCGFRKQIIFDHTIFWYPSGRNFYKIGAWNLGGRGHMRRKPSPGSIRIAHSRNIKSAPHLNVGKSNRQKILLKIRVQNGGLGEIVISWEKNGRYRYRFECGDHGL